MAFSHDAVLFFTNCKLLLISLSVMCTHIQSLIHKQLSSPPERGDALGAVSQKKHLLKRFSLCVNFSMALTEMSELRKTPPLQLLLAKSRKIQLNPLKNKNKNHVIQEEFLPSPQSPWSFL